MIEWRTILVGLVIVGSFLVAAYLRIGLGFPGTLSQFTLINHSSETVSETRLMQGGRELTVGGAIDPGQIRTTDFISHDGQLTLVVTLGTERSVSATDVGYLSATVPVTVTFEVTDNKVTLLTITKRREGSGRGR